MSPLLVFWMLLLIAPSLLAQDANALIRQGMQRYAKGQLTEALADFDRAAALDPAVAPELWQRGIALYQLGRFKQCKAQFESHRRVNPEDVENAAWHYLCTSRAESPAAARRQLIPIQRDGRPPMMTVQALFAGKAKVEDVVRDAEASKSASARFFADLYIGLYYEANGDTTRARPWLERAARAADSNDYMGAVAKIHWTLLY